jgi:hypothetical protein
MIEMQNWKLELCEILLKTWDNWNMKFYKYEKVLNDEKREIWGANFYDSAKKKCGDLSYAGNVVCPRLRPFDLRCDLDDTPLVLSETIPNEKRRGPTTLMNRYAVWGWPL